YRSAFVLPLLASLFLAGCGQGGVDAASTGAATNTQSQDVESSTAKTAAASSLDMSAGIQDLMLYMIDPAADFLWEAVSITITEDGIERDEPVTDEDWHKVKQQAFLVSEGANLLQVEGRHVVGPGEKLEDHGTEGNLTAEEVDAELDKDHAT